MKTITPYSREAIIEHMVQWFLHNYESVEENTPRDSGEWVYIHGEPVDTGEELFEAFDHLFAGDLIEAAAVQLEEDHDVDEWVPVPRQEAGDEAA
jgi:hypothetical protein